jgi:hypothetical protein
MPMYLRYRRIEKECSNLVDDGRGGTKRCMVMFVTTNPAAKYCPECKATKPWSTPALKRL